MKSADKIILAVLRMVIQSPGQPLKEQEAKRKTKRVSRDNTLHLIYNSHTTVLTPQNGIEEYYTNIVYKVLLLHRLRNRKHPRAYRRMKNSSMQLKSMSNWLCTLPQQFRDTDRPSSRKYKEQKHSAGDGRWANCMYTSSKPTMSYQSSPKQILT